MQAGIQFAIVGCGAIAEVHAGAIHGIAGAVLAGVYDAHREGAQKFAARHQCKVFDTLEELLQSPVVEVVNICTPSGTHAQIALAAAYAGKHVVVEKPLAITKQDLEALYQAEQDTGVKICVISQLRFAEGIQQAKRAMEEGGLGNLILGGLSMRYSRSEEYYLSSGWRGKWATDGGGALMNQGIHGLDLLCYLCGPVASVQARYKTLRHKIEVEDTLVAWLEFANGALGTLEASTAVHPGQPRRIAISGTKGYIELCEDEIVHWDGEIQRPEAGGGWGIAAANDPAAVGYEGHRQQLLNLIGAIQGKEKLLVDARQGGQAAGLILALYESAVSGKIVNL